MAALLKTCIIKALILQIFMEILNTFYQESQMFDGLPLYFDW